MILKKKTKKLYATIALVATLIFCLSSLVAAVNPINLAYNRQTYSYLSNESDPLWTANQSLYLKLNQIAPQTFTNLGGGTGLMKVTAGLLGLDTSTYLTAEADTLQSVTTRGATTTTVSTFSTAIKTPKIYPSADSTTAVQLLKANGATPVLNLDTTNGRLGIGTTAPMVALHSSDGAAVASTIKAYWNDASDIMISANQPQYGAGLRIAVAHNSAVTSRPVATFIRTRGTLETPADVQLNDQLGDLLFGGWGGTGINYGGGVFAYCDGTPTAGSTPMRISFVTGSNSGDRAERLKISANGTITVVGATTFSAATTFNVNPTINPTSGTASQLVTRWSTSTVRQRVGNYGSISPDSLYTTANLNFDGSNWQRDDVAKTGIAYSLDAGSGSVLGRFRYAAAGANPATLSTAWQVSNGGVFQVPKLGAIADSTTAMQFFKADGTTAVATIDTTNARLGIGTAAPLAPLDVLGASNSVGLADGLRVYSNNRNQYTGIDWAGIRSTYHSYYSVGNNNIYLLSNSSTVGTGGVTIGQSAGNANARLYVLGRPVKSGTGTISVTAGSTAVTGSGSLLFNEIGNGYVINVGSEKYPVKSVTDQTHATLYTPATITRTNRSFTYSFPTGIFVSNDQFKYFAADALGNFVSKGTAPQIIMDRTSGRAWSIRVGANNNNSLDLFNVDSNTIPFYIDGSAPNNSFYLSSTGRATITSTTEQLRLGYDASNYKSETVNSTGSVTTALTGTSPINIFSQAIRGNGGFQSSDGSAGITQAITIQKNLTATCTVTFKNGLATATTC